MLSLLSCYLLYSGLPLALAQQDIAVTNSTAQNATAFALLYGYPLLAFQKLASPFVESDNVNKLVHARQLATADLKAVVKPNVDTLYSVAIYDLGQSDVTLTIPEIPSSQYALFSFYDPFGDNFANLGTGNLNQKGIYELSRRSANTSSVGVVPATVSPTLSASAIANVHSPTDHGILLIRWLINDNYDEVHAWQNQTSLQIGESRKAFTPEGRQYSSVDPYLQNISRPLNSSSVADSVLRLLAQYEPFDPPQLLDQIAPARSKLDAAGIEQRWNYSRTGRAYQDGVYNAPTGIDLEAANRTALAAAAGAAANPSNNMPLNNGWCITKPSVSGNFENGTNHAYRAAIASSAYLMLQAPNAVYPSWTNTSSGQCSDASQEYTLGPNDSFIYTFSRRPPLQSTGFWSLTAYSDNYLIPNDLNRYGIGDRSNLTFADGTAVYGGKDGTFQVLIQPADVPPPANWTSNWIPGPAGGGNLTALLRWYVAKEELLNGTYEYPIVTKQAAVVQGQGGGGNNASSTTTLPGNGATASHCSWLLGWAVMVVLAFTMI